MGGRFNHWFKVLLTIALAMFFFPTLITVESQASISESITLVVNDTYIREQGVTVTVENEELFGKDLTSLFDLWIEFENTKYRYFGDLVFPLSFQVNSLGDYNVLITKKGSSQVLDAKTISVLDSKICSDFNLILSNNLFGLDEEVVIGIEPYNPFDISGVYILRGERKYRFVGGEHIAFFPSEPDDYVVRVECVDGSSNEQSFTVTNDTSQASESKEIEVEDAFLGPIASQGFEIRNPFGTRVPTAGTVIQTHRGQVVELKNPIASINSMRFRGVQDSIPNIGLDEISTPINVNNIPGVRSFAIDPTTANFTDVIVNVTAQGNTLFMCKDYDFETRDCWGSWQRVRDITPGEYYTFSLTPEDPLYTETNSTFDCSCEDSVTNSGGDTLTCETFCEFTIDIPSTAVSFFLEEVVYDMTFTVTTSAGVTGPSGIQEGYFDLDTTKNNGNEVLIGSSTESDTASFTWTKDDFPSSGSGSYTDLNCDGWPDFCTYYAYINATYTFGTPGKATRDVAIELNIDEISATINYTEAGDFSVTLENPSNNYYSNDSTIEFQFLPINANNLIDNCSVYTNESGWSAKNTSTSITNNTINSLDVSFSSEGAFVWNVQCADIDESIFAPTNRTIYIDTTSPTVELVSPTDSYVETDQSVVGFQYNVTDTSPISYCTLLIDGVGVSNQSSPSRNTVNTINRNMQNGVYNWSIACFDVAGNRGDSVNRTITVDIDPVLNTGLWYETATADCSTPTCEIGLAQEVDGTVNDMSGSLPSSSSVQFIHALSPFLGANGVDIEGSSQVLFNTFFSASGGNLEVRWYLYSRDDSNVDTLLCSNTGGTGATAGANSTGSCTITGNTYLESTDKLFYRIDMTNTHPAQTRSFTHPVDHLSSFIDIDNFRQVGFLSTNLTSPANGSVYGQEYEFNLTCEVDCEFAYCIDVDVIVQTNESGSWQNVDGTGIITLGTGQSNPENEGTIFNTTQNTTFLLETNSSGTTSLRCVADSRNQFEVSAPIEVTVSVTQEPVITLNYPENNSWINDEPVIFSYTPATFGTLDYCELYIDGVLEDTDNSPTENAVNTFSVSNLDEQRYNWSVTCVDTGSFVGNSSTFYFDIDRFAPYELNIFNPLNDTTEFSSTVTFNFSVLDARSSNMTCDLYINSTLNQSQVVQNDTVSEFVVFGFDLDVYTWYLACFDLANNTNQSDEFTLTIADIPPVVELLDPQNNTGVNVSPAVLTYIPYDGFGLQECSLYVNGTLNQTDLSPTPNENNTFEIPILEEPYLWLVECLDLNNNYANSSEFIFYGDFTPPNVTLNAPVDLAYFEVSTVDFSYTAFDNWPDLVCTININGEENATNLATSGVEVNQQVSGFADGFYDWNVTCFDIALNQNTSETRSYTVNETPNITLDFPINTTHISTLSPNLTYTPLDNDGFEYCELYLNGVFETQNQSNITSGVSQNFSLSGLTEGYYNWSVLCLDAGVFSNEFQTDNETFVLDVTPPFITPLDPVENQTVNTTSYTFEWQVTDNLADNLTCDLYLNEVLNQSNITGNNNTIFNYTVSGFVTADYNYSVECRDLAGNQNMSDTISFDVIVPPEVTLIAPANDTGDTIRDVTFTYIPSGGTGDFTSCRLLLNGVENQTNTSITANNFNSFIVNDMPDGEYFWNVECTDTGSLSGMAQEDFVYYVDNDPPYLIELFEPDNNSIVGVNNVTFEFRAFDAISPSMSCDIYITEDFSAPFRIATNLEVENATNTTFNYVTGDGNYSWYVECRDKAGLSEFSDEYFFEVIAPPNVTLISPANNTWFNQTTVDLVYYPEDDIQITSCQLFINGVANQSTGSPLNKENNTFQLTNLAQAEYNWTVACTDSDANTYAPPNQTFYVDTDSPFISLNSPINQVVLNISQVPFNWTVFDNLAPELTCDLFVNDTLNASGITVNNSEAYIETVSGFDDGVFNWSVACLDQAGNYNVSETELFEVQEPPTVLLGLPLQNHRTNITTVSLFYTPFDNSLAIDQCTLILNEDPNVSSSSITHGVEQNLTVSSLQSGSYLWDVECEDPSGNLGLNGTAKTFFIDLDPPIIDLISPEQDETFNQNDITFLWNATDFNESILISCDLYVTDPLGDRFIENITGLSGTLFNHTELNLDDGEHFWNVTCVDDLGNSNTSITRRFIINQPDLYIDETRITFNNTNPDLNETLNITANISNIGGVDAINALVHFYLGDPDDGGTLIGDQTKNVSANDSELYWVTWQIPEGLHSIWVVADPFDDIQELNESNNNASVNISVLRSIIDFPLNGSIFGFDEIEFEFRAQDFTGDNINYAFFIDGSPSIYTGTVIDNQTNFENLTLSEGVRSIILQVEDYLGRFKNSTLIQITVDLTPPVPIINTQNESWFNTSNPQINISLTDNLAQLINYTLYVNGSVGAQGQLSNGTADLVQLTGLGDGIYELILEGEDLAGNTDNSTPTIIYVDTVEPTITLNSPADESIFEVRDVQLNYTVFDNMADQLTCEINVGSQTFGPFTVDEGELQSYLVENLTEGAYDWNVTCTDLAGNQNTSETRTFNVFIPPEVTLISPANETWSPNSTNTFIYNVSDDTGILECRLYFNEVLNQTDTNVQNNQLNNFTVSDMDGVYEWRVECVDNTTFSTLGSSETWVLYVDLTAPVPVFLTQNNTWFNQNPQVEFNITDNLAQNINYDIFVNGTINASGTAQNNTLTQQTLTGLVDGYYELILRATDLAGNTQNTSPLFIYQDTEAPQITLNSPPNESELFDVNVNLSFTPTDNLANYLMCEVTLNNGVVASGLNVTNGIQETVELFDLAGGNYSWNVTCIDQASNSNTSETWTFSIPIPDLSVNESEIYFSNNNPTEGETVTVTATIRNIGEGDADNFTAQFWQDEIGGAGIQIESDILVPGLLVGEAVNVSVNLTAPIGDTEVFIIVDPLNEILEDSILNNNASRILTVQFWHFALGTTNDTLRITDASYGLLFDWGVSNSTGSNIFVSDFEADIGWNDLQALGRDVNGDPNYQDFETLDVALGSTGYPDSINNTYTTGGEPIETETFEFFGTVVDNVPVANSTNNDNFKTGILWDASDGGTSYDGTQEVIFITKINKNQAGFDDTYDFEIRIPATLRELNTLDTERVVFYTEIK